MAKPIPSRASVQNNSKMAGSGQLPYFDLLFRLLREGNRDVEASFGRHVHWGYWDDPQRAALTVEDFAEATENMSRRLCRAAGMVNGLMVLDVGCGFGGTVAHINENYADMNLIGINLDERQLQRARSLVISATGNRIEFCQGNACALPFPDETFDIVLAVECIFHFPCRETFFREARRVLKPGGRLALSDFVPSLVVAPFVQLRSAVTERFSPGFYGQCDMQCSKNDYRKFAEQNRFQNLTQEDVTEKTLPTYSYLKKLAHNSQFTEISAVVETMAAEWASRLKLLKYYLFAWRKL